MTSHEGGPEATGATGARPTRHPQALVVLALGMLAILGCGLTGPFAWRMGDRALADIKQSRGAIGGYEIVAAGRLCGIVGSAFLGLAGIMVVTALVAVIAGLL